MLEDLKYLVPIASTVEISDESTIESSLIQLEKCCVISSKHNWAPAVLHHGAIYPIRSAKSSNISLSTIAAIRASLTKANGPCRLTEVVSNAGVGVLLRPVRFAAQVSYCFPAQFSVDRIDALIGRIANDDDGDNEQQFDRDGFRRVQLKSSSSNSDAIENEQFRGQMQLDKLYFSDQRLPMSHRISSNSFWDDVESSSGVNDEKKAPESSLSNDSASQSSASFDSSDVPISNSATHSSSASSFPVQDQVHSSATALIRAKYDNVIESIQTCAIKALEGLNLSRTLPHKISLAAVQLELIFNDDGSVFDATVADISALSMFSLPKSVSSSEISEMLMRIIEDDLDESHTDLFELAVSACLDAHEVLKSLLQQLVGYLRLEISSSTSSPIDEYLLLKQARAIVIVGDLLWECKKLQLPVPAWQFSDESSLWEAFMSALTTKSSLKDAIKAVWEDNGLLLNTEFGYPSFINQFLQASNERELRDFERCATPFMPTITYSNSPASNSSATEGVDDLHFQNSMALVDAEPQTCWTAHEIESGMRVGISSANASDNWTFAKLKGGLVLNATINLSGRPPLLSRVTPLASNCIVLSSTDSILGPLSTLETTFDESNAMELFKYSDNNDRLRMLKYALIFTGIVRPNSENAQQVMDDLRRFMHPEMTDVIDQQSPQPQGFRLDLINNGPSRSGFASSSAVAVCLLQVLYMCSGQYDLGTDRIRLGSMALLFENRLGLKSGRQDVDGLLPNGLKILRYPPTTGFVCPEIETWSSEQFDFSALPSHFVLVDTGIPRPGFLDLRRGLNMRHWAFLSRDPLKYPAIRKSLGIHVQIVDAFRLQNWPRLGVLLTDYMQLRSIIDPGATSSVYDLAFGDKLLLHLFQSLKDRGLIHGGSFSGAMGGGVAMLIPTDLGVEAVDPQPSEPDAFNLSLSKPVTRLQSAIDELVHLKLPAHDSPFTMLQPFANMKMVDYSINLIGTNYTSLRISNESANS